MKSSPNVSKTPIPPMDFMSSTLGSDLGATLLSEDDEDEEEEERYAVVSKNLCGFEYTPGHSVDNLDGSGMFKFPPNLSLKVKQPQLHKDISLYI